MALGSRLSLVLISNLYQNKKIRPIGRIFSIVNPCVCRNPSRRIERNERRRIVPFCIITQVLHS